MKEHMTANQQKHILHSLQSLQQSNEEIKTALLDTRQELQDLRAVAVGLSAIGATVTFRVNNFPQLRREKKAWHSLPFNITDKVKVRLAVYPSGTGRGQDPHVSVSLKLAKVLIENRS